MFIIMLFVRIYVFSMLGVHIASQPETYIWDILNFRNICGYAFRKWLEYISMTCSFINRDNSYYCDRLYKYDDRQRIFSAKNTYISRFPCNTCFLLFVTPLQVCNFCMFQIFGTLSRLCGMSRACKMSCAGFTLIVRML